MGGTIYPIEEISIKRDTPGFLAIAMLNRLRREALAQLTKVRETSYTPERVDISPNTEPDPDKVLDF